jgi:large subunit ribosomal protein L23
MRLFDRLKGAPKKEEKPKAAKAASAKGGSASGGKVVAPKDAETKTAPKAKIEHGESDAHRVLVAPVVSEKTSRLEALGQYVFEVATGANKVEIKKAVERHYRVHVDKVNVVKVGGKIVRRGRTEGKRKDWSKAYVTLKKGETLVY